MISVENQTYLALFVSVAQLVIPIVLAVVGWKINTTLHRESEKQREHASKMDFIESATKAIDNLYEQSLHLISNNVRRNREIKDLESRLKNLPSETNNILLHSTKTEEMKLRDDHSIYLTKMVAALARLKGLIKEDLLVELDKVVSHIQSIAVEPGSITDDIQNKLIEQLVITSKKIHDQPDTMARHHWS